MSAKLHIIDRKTTVKERTIELLENWLELAKAGEVTDILIAGFTEQHEYLVNASATMDIVKQFGLLRGRCGSTANLILKTPGCPQGKVKANFMGNTIDGREFVEVTCAPKWAIKIAELPGFDSNKRRTMILWGAQRDKELDSLMRLGGKDAMLAFVFGSLNIPHLVTDVGVIAPYEKPSQQPPSLISNEGIWNNSLATPYFPRVTK